MQWKHMQNATKEVWKNRKNKNGQQDGESLSNFLFLPYSDSGGGEFLFFYGQCLGGEGQKPWRFVRKDRALMSSPSGGIESWKELYHLGLEPPLFFYLASHL